MFFSDNLIDDVNNGNHCDDDDEDDDSKIRQGCDDLCGSVSQLKLDQDITPFKISPSS